MLSEVLKITPVNIIISGEKMLLLVVFKNIEIEMGLCVSECLGECV